jgi:hypothetical protein
LKLLITIATLLVVITPSIAADFTYKEYAKESDNWKRGFVLGSPAARRRGSISGKERLSAMLRGLD